MACLCASALLLLLLLMLLLLLLGDVETERFDADAPSDICTDRHAVLAVTQELRASNNTTMAKKAPAPCKPVDLARSYAYNRQTVQDCLHTMEAVVKHNQYSSHTQKNGSKMVKHAL